jgi:hypothetical protein
LTKRTLEHLRQPSWAPPVTTPTADGDGELGYEVHRGDSDPAFSLRLEPGEHELVVRCTADASASFTEPTVTWQLAYVLAPAREWASFGGLDVEIIVPERWRAAASPALVRDGDTLRGSFDALPSDAIAIATQMEPPFSYSALVAASWLALLVVAIAGLPLCGRICGTQSRSWFTAGVRAVVVAASWSAAFVGALVFVLSADHLALAEQAPPSSDYGSALLVLAASIGAPIVALVVCIRATRRPTRRTADE